MVCLCVLRAVGAQQVRVPAALHAERAADAARARWVGEAALTGSRLVVLEHCDAHVRVVAPRQRAHRNAVQR